MLVCVFVVLTITSEGIARLKMHSLWLCNSNIIGIIAFEQQFHNAHT